MVVGGIQQETPDIGFVLLGTRQQCAPLILKEPMLAYHYTVINQFGFIALDKIHCNILLRCFEGCFANPGFTRLLSLQQPTVRENKPDPTRGRNQRETLEVNRIHIEESTQLCHKESPHLESSRPKEKRKTKEHITPRSGDKHKKNEQKLDRTRKEGPGKSGLENGGWRPMLHRE
ncbi:unnamed protein product [Schistosoma margrebowiei]|uniref:Uncharacterized protein n=1 Tax=Schistosoma margrebowiei TaxID=48269 RepID=A0A183MMH0_9TREM|nr:unnamed protein product [Schistosoma margrebowiei]